MNLGWSRWELGRRRTLKDILGTVKKFKYCPNVACYFGSIDFLRRDDNGIGILGRGVLCLRETC